MQSAVWRMQSRVSYIEFYVIDVEVGGCGVECCEYEHMIAGVDVTGIHLSPERPYRIG